MEKAIESRQSETFSGASMTIDVRVERKMHAEIKGNKFYEYQINDCVSARDEREQLGCFIIYFFSVILPH